MRLLRKLFGGGAVSLESVRKAIREKRFADASRMAAELGDDLQTPEERSELARLSTEAGDGLARLNLDEALGLRRCGKEEQAEDYFQLALEKVCSEALKTEIEQARDDYQREGAVSSNGGAAGCGGCSTGTSVEIDEAVRPDDTDQQLELILTSYPEAIADRYLGKSPLFQEAFLLAQEGREAESLKLWSQVAPEEQDDLYFFELGSLLGRVGELDKARRLLESALDKNPELLLAVDALIPVLITLGDFEGAEKQLRRMRDAGIDPAFCHAQLATVYARQGDVVRAVEEVRAALNKGNADQAFFVFAAKLLEHQGAADEAEGLLKRLPASGCKGGVNLPLAEFWLRHKRELGKILDTFNAACREDPQNPRWQLRVAQTYMARNWTKDGIKLLKKVVDDPRLEPELAEEARSLLDEALV